MSAYAAFISRVRIDAYAERDAELAEMRAALDMRALWTRRAVLHLYRACFAHGFAVQRAVNAGRLFRRCARRLLKRGRL